MKELWMANGSNNLMMNASIASRMFDGCCGTTGSRTLVLTVCVHMLVENIRQRPDETRDAKGGPCFGARLQLDNEESGVRSRQSVPVPG